MSKELEPTDGSSPLLEDIRAADALVKPKRGLLDKITFKSFEVGRRLKPDGTKEEYFRAEVRDD